MEREMRTLNDFLEICGLPDDVLPKNIKGDSEINRISCFPSEISKNDVVIWTGGYKELNIILDVDFLCAFVKDDIKSHYLENDRIISIEEPYEAIVKCIEYFRSKLNVKTVITCGSVHANLLCRLVSHVLSNNGFKVFDYGIDSMNNSARFTLSNIQRLKEHETDVDVWIQEISGARDGEIESLHDSLKPDVTVLTDIKESITKNYSSDKSMIEDLLSVCNHKPNKSCYVIDKDIIPLKNHLHNSPGNWSYIYDDNTYVNDIYERDSSIKFNIVDSDDIYPARVKNLSRVSVDIAFATYVICTREFNLNASDIVTAIDQYKFEFNYKHVKRLSSSVLYLKENVKDYTEATKTVERFLDINNKGNKRLVIVTDFIQNKGRSDIIRDYYNLGRLISGKNIDYVITYGNYSEYISSGIIMGSKTRFLHCKTILQLQTWIKENFSNYNSILSISHKSEAADPFKLLLGGMDIKTVFLPQNTTRVHKESLYFNEHKFGLEIFNAPKSLVKLDFRALKLAKDIKSIANGAFSRCRSLEEIDLHDDINYIGSGAFYICPSLKRVSLPSNLKILGDSAFNYCIKLETINVPEGVIHIGRRAFYECKELKNIYIPSSVKYIGEEAFSNCPNVNVYIKNNEYVEAYCKENNIQYYVKKRGLF